MTRVTIHPMKWIRKRLPWVAATMVAGFVLWLVSTVISSRANNAVAAGVLFGRQVPLNTFTQAYEAALHQARLTHGERFNQEVTPEKLEDEAWQWLTLVKEAERQKIQVSDREVVGEIASMPLFQREGQFDERDYPSLVQYLMGTSPRTFEEETRQRLMIRKLIDKTTGNVAVNPEELKQFFQEREESIQVRYVPFPSEPLAREVADAAAIDPAQMPRAVKQLKLSIETSDFVKRSDPVADLGTAGNLFEPAFRLEPGQVAGPFASPKGWLLVECQAKRPADEAKFPSMKESLEKELLSQKRLITMIGWYQDLTRRASLKKNPLAFGHKK